MIKFNFWRGYHFPRKLKKLRPPKAARRLRKRIRKELKAQALARARAINAFNVPSQGDLIFHEMTRALLRSLQPTIYDRMKSSSIIDWMLNDDPKRDS